MNHIRLIIIFLISLIFGFSVLIFRNVYEDKTGDAKSHWNTVQLEEGDSKNFFDRGLVLSEGKAFHSGLESAPIISYTRGPVYPFFLAFIFIFFGVSLKAVIIIQIIFVSLIACLISSISKLIFNNIISWFSGILILMYYPIWNEAVQINCELIAMFMGLLALYFILKFYYSNGTVIKYLLLSGLFVGLSALTRGQFFYYSFLFLIFIFGISNTLRSKKIKFFIYWFTVVLVTALSWSVYAYISSGTMIFLSSQGAMSIWWGWSPAVVLHQQYPIWNSLWDSDKDIIKADLHAVYLPVKSSFWFIKEAINFIIEYPNDSLKIAYFKLIDSWGMIVIYTNQSIFVKIFKVLKNNWDFLLAIPAWIIIWKLKEYKIFFQYTILACIIYLLISLMTAGLIRYRVPFLDPLFVILASYTIYKIFNYFKTKKLNS